MSKNEIIETAVEETTAVDTKKLAKQLAIKAAVSVAVVVGATLLVRAAAKKIAQSDTPAE